MLPSIRMSPISRMARLLLILHAFVNIVFGIYPFVNPGEYAAITGVEGPDKTLQSIGKSGFPIFVSRLEHPHKFADTHPSYFKLRLTL